MISDWWTLFLTLFFFGANTNFLPHRIDQIYAAESSYHEVGNGIKDFLESLVAYLSMMILSFTNECFKGLIASNWDIDYCYLVHLPGRAGGVGFLGTVSSALTGSTLWPLFNFGFLGFFLPLSIPNRKHYISYRYIQRIIFGHLLIQLLGWDTCKSPYKSYICKSKLIHKIIRKAKSTHFTIENML